MRVLWISAVALLLDQVTKVVVLNTMYRQQSIPLVGDWLRFTFTENPGMAFGMQFGPKGTVTVLALFATILVGVYVYSVRNAYLPYRASLALIFGGAVGNMIDRIFYGEILGYGDLFMGKVVDFIHVSVWQGFVPEWVPRLGGAYVDLFPIWNVADMSIVCGVVGVLLFHQKFHEHEMARHAARDDDSDLEERDGQTEGPDAPLADGEGAVPAAPPASAQESHGAAPPTDGATSTSAPSASTPSDPSSADPSPADGSPPHVPTLEDVDADGGSKEEDTEAVSKDPSSETSEDQDGISVSQDSKG